MEFKHGEHIYKIEFGRLKQSFVILDPVEPGVKHTVAPHNPNKTVVRLTQYAENGLGKVVPTGLVYQSESVCKGPDKFRLEEGRLRALRHLTRKLPKDLIPLMWNAYHKRPKHNEWLTKRAIKNILYGYGHQDKEINDILAAAEAWRPAK